MDTDKWKVQYEQLNQRSRWYSTELWAVPFAYMGLVGVAAEKITKIPECWFRGIGFLFLALFSLTVFVHVSSIKHYERKAVWCMRKLEDPPCSSGGSRWYLDYTFFIRGLVASLSFFFAILGIQELNVHKHTKLSLHILLLGALIVIYLLIVVKDYCRNRKLKEQIKDVSEC